MSDGVCPKCGGSDVRRNVTRNSPWIFFQLDFESLRPARVENLICAACGYMESYVCKDDLAAVAQ